MTVETEAMLVARQQRRLGPDLQVFYDFPFHPVSGKGVWLLDGDGRAYLDAYNNVPQVGHGHPDVVAALSRRATKLKIRPPLVFSRANVDMLALADVSRENRRP